MRVTGLAAKVMLIPSGTDVNGRFDPDGMGGCDLSSQQVKSQSWMHTSGLGRMIRKPMMTFGKQSDRIDVPNLKRLLELFGTKVCPNLREVSGCVKVEMNLTEAEWRSHGNEVFQNQRRDIGMW